MSRIRKFLLAVLFFAACSPSLEPLLKSQGQQGPNAAVHKIQVVIVAVPHFAIADYNDDVVRDAFNDQCTRLKTYFEQEFGRENVDVRPYCTTAKTTRESLRHLFSIDLPQFGAHTLTLIFIMSHGEEVTFGNGFLSSDLELITSDTFTSDDNRDSKGERQFSSILFGSELMSWLQRVPAGSTTLLFLDTCHSGAAASLSASLTGQLQQYFGLGSHCLQRI